MTPADNSLAAAPPRRWRSPYLQALGWAFAAFNGLRVFAYMPTLWAIHGSGDSSQYSAWTWGHWLGANLTMAAWLFENNAQRLNPAVWVHLGNSGMCAATLLLILWYRY